MRDITARGIRIMYAVAEIEYPWLSRIWERMKHVEYVNKSQLYVHIFHEFDPHALLDWLPICRIISGKRASQFIELPFAYQKRALPGLVQLDFNVFRDGENIHSPGRIGDQLMEYGLAPDYILVSQMRSMISDIDLFLFAMPTYH